MLSFEEWLRLPNDKERGERCKELSDSDRFKVRMGDYYFGDKPGLTDSMDKNFNPEIPDFLKDKEINVEQESTQEK